MNTTWMAVDLAKDVYEIAVSPRVGEVSERLRLSRAKFLRFFANRESANVVMEACGSAHHWAREIEKLGHRVVLLPPQHVRPYVMGNKTDRSDASALLEARRNQRIRPVPIKTHEQQSLNTLHRVRQRWMKDRTARINELRGHLREFGLFIPKGRQRVLGRVREWLADAESAIPHAIRDTLWTLCNEVDGLTDNIKGVERQLDALGRQNEVISRLETVPGIGMLTATAMFAVVGDIGRFPSARHFASFLGLTPREHSSGHRVWRGGITKRGDSYLRTLLVHGGRSVLAWAKRKGSGSRLATWALEVEKRRGPNKAAVALANKRARILFALWSQGTAFEDERLHKREAA